MAMCPNCGSNIPNGSAFCTSCGARVTQPSGGYGGGATYTGGGSGSTWTGGVLETVAASIVTSLIITFTCGIATPWAVCYMYNFILSHTVIDGKKLRFDGTGGELFGNWIVWAILTTVTCGIYGFWVTPKMYQWIASHTHME